MELTEAEKKLSRMIGVITDECPVTKIECEEFKELLKNQELAKQVDETGFILSPKDDFKIMVGIIERLKKEIESMGVSSQDYHAYEVEELLEEVLRGKKNETKI